jgi:hypothetical protein
MHPWQRNLIALNNAMPSIPVIRYSLKHTLFSKVKIPKCIIKSTSVYSFHLGKNKTKGRRQAGRRSHTSQEVPVWPWGHSQCSTSVATARSIALGLAVSTETESSLQTNRQESYVTHTLQMTSLISVN